MYDVSQTLMQIISQKVYSVQIQNIEFKMYYNTDITKKNYQDSVFAQFWDNRSHDIGILIRITESLQ